MAARKVKVLLVGSVGSDSVQDFVHKMGTLQKSKAGPFDVCFVLGTVNSTTHTTTLESLLKDRNVSELPIQTYVVEGASSQDETALVESTVVSDLRILRGTNIWSIDVANTQLVVATCPHHVRMDSTLAKPLMDKVSHVSYVGCDLFLSDEWPQGVEQVLQSNNTNNHEKITTTGSYDVAEMALRARPRYHVAPHVQHVQSHPFRHLAATSSTFTPKHVGRFLTLAAVVAPQHAKSLGKAGKFVHALGLIPLMHMPADELEVPPSQQVLPCPYTDASYAKDDDGATATTGGTAAANSNSSLGLSEAQARRLLSETSGTAGDSHARWRSNKRQRTNSDQGRQSSRHYGNEEEEVDTTSTTLFLHGLHKDVRGVLQTASAALLQAFAKYHVERVRRPPAASSYAFLEFATHSAAKQCLEETGGETVVEGVHLTLKWATTGNSKQRDDSQQPNKKRRLTEAEAMDSCTLYFRLPASSSAVKEDAEKARHLMEQTLEHALGDPDVTAKAEPALQVKMRLPDEERNFGFLEFASHAAASMAVATLTGNTDGGLVLAETTTDLKLAVSASLLGLALHWAHDAKPEGERDSRGLNFQRKHFPPDARTDCWFCLASPTCEKHLIVSIHNECYIAMPKGPVDPGHVLLIPVTHSSKGALVDKAVADEMEGLKQQLRQHASEIWQKDLFVFERAIQTKGGYHTHVQCVPVDRGLGIKIHSTILGMARAVPGFDLRELNSDLGLAALVNSDDEDNGGYFYAEVPFGAKECKRLLYKARTTADGFGRRQTVPIQFGREVLAAVLGNPDLAHWKACVVDKEKETEIADAFRESFTKVLPSS